MQNKSISKNFVYNLVLTASNMLLPLITFQYTSRVLQADCIGRINFATSVVNYFVMFAALGIPTYGIRACAKVRDNRNLLSKTVQELLLINIATMLIALSAMLIAIAFIPRFRTEMLLLLINALLIVFNPMGYSWFYSALEEYRYITMRSISVKVLSLCAVFLFVHTQNDYILYTLINIFATVGSNVLNFIYSRKYVSYKKKATYNFKQHFKPILIFFATSVAVNVYTNMDTVMLGFMAGNSEIGYYAVALKVRSALAAMVTVLSTVVLPRLSYYATCEEYAYFDHLISKSMKFTIAMAVPIVVFFVLHARPTIMLISGIGYLPAVPAFCFLTISILFAGITGVVGTQLLVPLGYERQLLSSIVCGAVIDFILNLIFINKYGATGAAFATMVAECMVLIAQILISWNYLKLHIKLHENCKVIISTGVAFIILIMCNQALPAGYIKFIFDALLFFGIYGVGLLLLKHSIALEVLNRLKILLNKGKKKSHM